MFKLTIRRADGSIYWQDAFNSLEAAHSWLKDEKTRSYWQAEYVAEVTDATPIIDTSKEIERLAREKRSREASVRLNNIDWLTIKGDATLIAVVKDLILKG